MCDYWFVLERGDGLVRRVILVSDKKELISFGIFFCIKIFKDIFDGYFWIFVVGKLFKSNFICV